jgi:hypothetical protein
MGLNFLDGTSAVAYINSVNSTLGLTSTGDISFNTGLNNTIIGLPFVFSFAASDENTPITTTGLKVSVRAPQDFQLSKIKISLNIQPGASFTVEIKKNGVQCALIPTGNNFFATASNATALVEDDLIQLEITNVGSSTGTGLKCYLVGKTV